MERTRTTSQTVAKPRGNTSKAAVLTAAEEVFANRGFAAASLDEIAEKLGIRRPSLLHHYSSKRLLYDAVEQDIFDAMCERMASMEEASTHFDALIALLNLWLDFMSARPSAARIILRNASDLVARSANPMDFAEVVFARFERIILAGAAAGEFAPVRPVLLIHIVSTSLLHFICNADNFGPTRDYDYRDQATREEFMAMITQTARTLLTPGS
jgi:TetR/AcrR family transcriptional regulator